jgi:regulator of sigma E protease
MPAKICSVKKGSPAENAGITQFSSIISLNNKKISNRATLLQILHEVRNSKNIKIEFEDKEKNIKSSTIPFLESFNARPFLGITFCPFNFENNTFEALPEELTISGVKVGDKLIEINGKKIKALEELFKIKSDTKEVLTLKVQSPEGDIKIAKLPLEEEQTIFLGAAAKPATVFVYFPLFQAIHFGLKDAMEIINMTFWSLKALIVREVSPKELAGPVGIINISYKVLQKSFVHFLYILALISLNLAILNILPIPILDGSLIVLFTIEKLLRKKLSEKFVKTFEIAGFCILISLLLFTLKNDIFRLFGK